MAGRLQYAYEYVDFTYPDAQSKLDARTEDGWEIQDSNLAHPYLFVLWVRPWPGSEAAGPDLRAVKRDHRSPAEQKASAERAAARAAGA